MFLKKLGRTRPHEIFVFDKDGDTFIGTLDNAAVHYKMTRHKLYSETAKGNISRKSTGEVDKTATKKGEKKAKIYVFTFVDTNEVFVGTRLEFMREYHIGTNAYVDLKKEGKLILDELGSVNDRVSQPHIKRQLNLHFLALAHAVEQEKGEKDK